MESDAFSMLYLVISNTNAFSEVEDQLTEKISRIAFLEGEMREHRQSVYLCPSNTATLYYPTETTEEVVETSTSVTIDIAQIFDEEVVAVRTQALDFSTL